MDANDQRLEEAKRNPANVDILARYCLNTPLDQIPQALSFLAQRLAAPPIVDAVRLFELRFQAILLEKNARHREGRLSARSLKDTEFLFAHDAVLQLVAALEAYVARKSTENDAVFMLAEALCALGRHSEAQAYFARLAGKMHFSASQSVDFDPHFHARLDEMDPAHGHPALIVNQPGVIGPRAIFVAGDGVYFRNFGRQLLRSLRRHNVSIALHLMDARPEYIDEIQTLHYVSSETTGLSGQAAKNHYHAIRFARLSQFLNANPHTAVWFVDMDSLFMESPAPLFDLLAGNDLTPHFASCRMEIRNKISAHMLGISPTAPARRFIHRVAAYLSFMSQTERLSWGTDQVALYAVLSQFPDPISCSAFVAPQTIVRAAKKEA